MKTDLDRLIASIGAVGTVAVPLAEVLSLGPALARIMSILSPAAVEAITSGASSVPMTISDIEALRSGQPALSTFDAPSTWSFNPAMQAVDNPFSAPFDLDLTAARVAITKPEESIGSRVEWDVAQTVSHYEGKDPCQVLRERLADMETIQTRGKLEFHEFGDDGFLAYDYMGRLYNAEDCDEAIPGLREAIARHCKQSADNRDPLNPADYGLTRKQNRMRPT